MQSLKVEQEEGTWIFIAPISGVALGENSHFSLIKLFMVKRESIPYLRNKIGLNKRISEIHKKSLTLKKFLQRGNTFITQRLTGQGSKTKKESLRKVEEELYILAFSQLGYRKRKQNSYPCITKQYPSGIVSFLLYNSDNNSWTQPNYSTGKNTTLVLNSQWKKFHRKSFFIFS